MSWIWSQSEQWNWGNTWPLDRIFGRVQFERGPTVWPLMIDYNHSHFHLSHLSSGDVGGFFNLLKGVGFCRLSPELTDWSTDRAVSVRRSSKQFARRWPPPPQRGGKTTCPLPPSLPHPIHLIMSTCHQGTRRISPPSPFLLNWPLRTNYFTGIVPPSSLQYHPTPPHSFASFLI